MVHIKKVPILPRFPSLRPQLGEATQTDFVSQTWILSAKPKKPMWSTRDFEIMPIENFLKYHNFAFLDFGQILEAYQRKMLLLRTLTRVFSFSLPRSVLKSMEIIWFNNMVLSKIDFKNLKKCKNSHIWEVILKKFNFWTSITL